jgi:hypothetical protein
VTSQSTTDSATGGDVSDVLDITLHSLAGAYAAEGYEQGYARGSRDLLALYPLLIEQFLHARGDVTPEIRRAVRDFGRFVEDRIGRRLDEAGFVDGAGI